MAFPKRVWRSVGHIGRKETITPFPARTLAYVERNRGAKTFNMRTNKSTIGTGIYSDNLGKDDKGDGDHFQRTAKKIEAHFEAKELTLYERMDLQIKLMRCQIEHSSLNELIHQSTMLEYMANMKDSRS